MPNLNKLPSPSVIMITSSFCSKCHFNRKLWQDVANGEVDLIEFNLADERNKSVLDLLHPLMAPTLYIINKNRTEFTYEGVLNSEIVKSMIKICNKLNSDT